MSVQKAPTPSVLAPWWRSYQSKASDDLKRIADALLHSAALAAYWKSATTTLIRAHPEAVEETCVYTAVFDAGLMWSFLNPAELGLHITGTVERPTCKTQLRRQHKNDRSRASTAAGHLKNAAELIAAWECRFLKPRLATSLFDANGPTARSDNQPRTHEVLQALATALEEFSGTDGLADVASLKSQKASWLDYVRRVRHDLSEIERSFNVELQPTVVQWQAVVAAVTGKEPDVRSVKNALDD
ncbi:MAG: hypothetical protein JWO70_2466 [Betaproteobacteria bacterium]|nr:hypothetical protein [Betaproteobacteria bacterium]